MTARIRCISPEPGENVHQLVDRLVADGQLAQGDADAVHDFAQYLADLATHGDPSSWGPNLLRRHREALGLTHARIDAIEAGQDSAATPGPTVRNVPRSRARPAGAAVYGCDSEGVWIG